MRYLLVVGFGCDVYRREPRARIFVGDRLIDEFYIPHKPRKLFTSQQELSKKLHPLQPLAFAERNNFLIKNYPPLKFYELQFEDEISNLSIRIEIDNHDSDYSNGYMRRSTLIRLEVCAFFPFDRRVLTRLHGIKIKNRNRNLQNYAWYRGGNKNTLFDMWQNDMHWIGSNGQKFQANNQYNVGGDGEFVIALSKKYGILMQPLSCACRYTFSDMSINYLFDKYEQHANQRNNN